MIVILKHSVTDLDKKNIVSFLENRGFKIREIVGEEETVLGAVGLSGVDLREVEQLAGVDRVIPVSKPYKLASRELHREDTVISVGDIAIGGNRIVVMAGPRAVESREQMIQVAEIVAQSGAVLLCGDAFMPGSGPYSAFQGLEEEGLKCLFEAGKKYNMPIVSEVLSAETISVMKPYVDIFRVGARNMQNFELLKKLGSVGKPVILTRGLAATIEEWLLAAEYLLANGNEEVILCERGIRTFENETRNTLDLSSLPVLKKLTHLPVLVDPSDGTGRRDSILPMGLAAISAGAAGLLVEVHPNPDQALTDGAQSLYGEQFEKLMRDIQVLAPVVGKEVALLSKKQEELPQNNLNRQKSDLIAVGFQGEPGAYSEAALYNYFDSKQYQACSFKTFKDVFDAVLSKEVSFGLLPVENSLAGSVHENYDLVIRYPDVHIIGETRLRVEHNLIGFPGVEIKSLKRIYSHPQALAQSARFLDSLEGVERIAVEDTSGAVKMIAGKKDPQSGAIASLRAASVWNMAILKKGLETNPRNYTRFVVIERGKPQLKQGDTKGSFVFSVKDKPGALFQVLAAFEKYHFNLKKLESRPIHGKPWEYLFYIDVDLSDHPEQIHLVLEEMKPHADQIRVLGFYRGMAL